MPSQQGYDPSAPAPYQAPAMPGPSEAMPSPLPNQPVQVNGAVRTSGAIATMADSMLRGFFQGRAYHQASAVMQAKKKSDDLQTSYNQDAARLYQLHAAGVDSNSAEYKTAKSAAEGSYGAMLDYYGQHLEPQQDGKKKGKGKPAEGGLLGALQSKDPMQVSQAWYQIARKSGPPVFSQIAALQTPQADQARQTHATVAQTQGAAARNDLSMEEAKGVRIKYAGYTEEQKTALPEGEQQKLKQADALFAKEQSTSGSRKLYAGPDGKSKEWYVPGSQPQGWNAVGGGTGGHPGKGWGKDDRGRIFSFLKDPQTNQMVADSQNYAELPPPSLMPHIHTGFYTYTDPSDGSVHQVPVTSSTSPMLPHTINSGATAGATPQPASHEAGATPPRHPFVPKTEDDKARYGSQGQHHPETPHVPQLHSQPHDRVIGHKGVAREKFAQLEKDTSEAYGKAQAVYDKSTKQSDEDADNPSLGISGDKKEAYKKAHRERAYGILQTENRRIAQENHNRLVALGGTPGDGHPSSPAPQPPSSPQTPPPAHQDAAKPRKIYQHGKLLSEGSLTDAQVKAIMADPGTAQRGITIDHPGK